MHIPYKSSFKSTNQINERDDLDIIRDIQNGEKQDYKFIVEKYGDRIRNLVYLIISDRLIVDDLAQDIFIKAYQSIENFRFESSFYTWLYRIAVNKCRDEIRKRRIRKVISFDFMISKKGEMADPSNEYDALDDNMLIEEALSKLSISQREIITLRDIDNMTYQEISEILNCEVGTVKSRLSRARIELAKTVKKMVGEFNVKPEKNKASFSLS